MDKLKQLAIAEILDAYRVIPRLLLVVYGWFVYHVSSWFMELSNPTTEHTAFVASVVGVASIIASVYTATGRKWN